MRDSYLDGAIVGDRESIWRRRLTAETSDKPLVLLLEDFGALLGFVCILHEIDPVWGTLIDNLHVAPGFTRRGFGRRLLGAAAESLIQKDQNYPLHLWVFEKNSSACRFYEAIGGAVAGREVQRESDGSDILSCRYVWRSPGHMIMSTSTQL